jgi:hypothetical protein
MVANEANDTAYISQRVASNRLLNSRENIMIPCVNYPSLLQGPVQIFCAFLKALATRE